MGLVDFDQFWREYPRKVGKLAAERMWQRRQPPLADVLEALAWQTRSDQWQKGYIPHPTTYLSQGRWLDQAPVGLRPLGALRDMSCPQCGAPEPCVDIKVCNQNWLDQQNAHQEA